MAIEFLKYIGSKILVALSPDYETRSRLNDVIRETFSRIKELHKSEPDLPKALGRFADDQAVRILTIHKSKGLEFDSVIIMAVETRFSLAIRMRIVALFRRCFTSEKTVDSHTCRSARTSC